MRWSLRFPSWSKRFCDYIPWYFSLLLLLLHLFLLLKDCLQLLFIIYASYTLSTWIKICTVSWQFYFAQVANDWMAVLACTPCVDQSGRGWLYFPQKLFINSNSRNLGNSFHNSRFTKWKKNIEGLWFLIFVISFWKCSKILFLWIAICSIAWNSLCKAILQQLPNILYQFSLFFRPWTFILKTGIENSTKVNELQPADLHLLATKIQIFFRSSAFSLFKILLTILSFLSKKSRWYVWNFWKVVLRYSFLKYYMYIFLSVA